MGILGRSNVIRDSKNPGEYVSIIGESAQKVNFIDCRNTLY